MNTKITLIIGIAASLMIFFSGCSDNSSNGGCGAFNGGAWFQAVSDESVALSEAGAEWGQDPTSLEKCEVYKKAYSKYVDALQDVNVSCFTVGANEQEYKEMLAEAKNEINDLDCSEEVQQK